MLSSRLARRCLVQTAGGGVRPQLRSRAVCSAGRCCQQPTANTTARLSSCARSLVAHATSQASAARALREGIPRIEVFTGPMFAGKTKALLSTINVLEENEEVRVAVFKSSVDTRYSKSEVVTHEGERRACRPVATLLSVLELPEYQTASVVAVDEAQFFPDLRQFCERAAGEEGKVVLVAGLSLDFRQQQFGQILDVQRLIGELGCGEVHNLSAACMGQGRYASDSPVCPNPATMTERLSNMQQQELVGGADVYRSVCRSCYSAPKRLLEVPSARELRSRAEELLEREQPVAADLLG